MTPPPFKEVKCLSQLRIYLLASYFLHLATREAAALRLWRWPWHHTACRYSIFVCSVNIIIKNSRSSSGLIVIVHMSTVKSGLLHILAAPHDIVVCMLYGFERILFYEKSNFFKNSLKCFNTTQLDAIRISTQSCYHIFFGSM